MPPYVIIILRGDGQMEYINAKEIEEKQSYNELFGVNPKNILSEKEKEIMAKQENEKVCKTLKKYRNNHHEYFLMSSQKYRSKKLLLPNTLTLKQWKQVKEYFENRCAYCGKKLPLAQEHFIALSKKGEYTINNIIPSCRVCNSSKIDKDFFEWYPKQKFYSKERERKILKYLGYKNNKIQQLKIG